MLILSAGSAAGAGLYRGPWPIRSLLRVMKGVEKNLGAQELNVNISAFPAHRSPYIGKSPPPPPQGGGINMAGGGKKYHKNNGLADKKWRERKEGQGIRKEKWQNDRARTMFHKIMGNLEKMQAIGDMISYFFPPHPNIILIVTLKRVQKSNWEKIYDIFPPVSLFFPP
jgi:hypothetical protein